MFILGVHMQRNRVYGLDILRALAISTVVFMHGFHYISTPSIIYDFVPDGVLIFFVLSGFLIGGILLRTVNKNFTFKSLTHFWFRRWFRTLPAYFFVLIILMCFEVLTHKSKITSEFLPYFFFLQNVTNGDAKFYGESWSLTIEEWFYLTIPLALFISMMLTSITKRKVVLFWILFTIASVSILRIYRAQFLFTVDDWDKFSRRALITRLDCIMYGFLGAYLQYYKSPLWNKKNTLFLFGIFLHLFNLIEAFLFGFGPYSKYAYLIVESLAILMVLPKLDSIKQGKGVVFKIITYISTVSYSLYLINSTPFSTFLIPWLSSSKARFVGFWLWAFFASYLLYHFVERPMMRLRDRVVKL
jgi:peptidoglycan/LPS O-acetylase OafA/YrhL